jgi:predicted GIY-YIG superfamily endonuclease
MVAEKKPDLGPRTSDLGNWFVYIVRCRDGSLYTGVTNDLGRRIAAHNGGRGARYTRSRSPVVLVYQESAPDRAAAQRREHRIRCLRTREKRRLFRPEA